VTQRRALIGGGVLLVLAVMLFVAALVGIFSGRGSPVEVANEVEPDPTTPCEFEEGKSFCVSEAGDVYYDTLRHSRTCEADSTSFLCIFFVPTGAKSTESGAWMALTSVGALTLRAKSPQRASCHMMCAGTARTALLATRKKLKPNLRMTS
jgi:hypothetical protein